MFKKSIVALAVLASGAAFAQVSVTGTIVSGFSGSNTPVGANSVLNKGTLAVSEESSSGFGVDTAEINFSVKEDLGGGMRAKASLGLVDMARGSVRGAGNVNTGFGAGNTSLSLQNSMGEVRLSTARKADYLSAGVAGVGGNYMDGRVFNARSSVDSLEVIAPIGPVTATFTYAEPNNALGLGTGTSGVTGSRQIGVEVQYDQGALSVTGGYLSNENVGDKGHYRAAASYDFGVAKVGGGFEFASTELNSMKSTTTDMLLAVSVPLGAVNLGLNWAQREVKDQTTGNGTFNGYGVKSSYSLSKRTALSADYTIWTGYVNAPVQSQYNLFVSHSF